MTNSLRLLQARPYVELVRQPPFGGSSGVTRDLRWNERCEVRTAKESDWDWMRRSSRMLWQFPPLSQFSQECLRRNRWTRLARVHAHGCSLRKAYVVRRISQPQAIVRTSHQRPARLRHRETWWWLRLATEAYRGHPQNACSCRSSGDSALRELGHVSQIAYSERSHTMQRHEQTNLTVLDPLSDAISGTSLDTSH